MNARKASWLVAALLLAAVLLAALGVCVGSAGFENLLGPLLNPDLDPDARTERTGGDRLADDRSTGHLADDEQPAGGLRVGEQDELLLGDVLGEQVRAHPVEVAARASGDVPGRERLTRARAA